MTIPLIDCDPQLRSESAIAEDVDRALREAGFMALLNLGPVDAAVTHAFDLAREFFAAPETVKTRCAYTAASENFGYQRLLSESLDPSRPADLKETFTMRDPLASRLPAERWPGTDFRAGMTALSAGLMLAARRLQHLLALALNVPEDFFVDCHSGENITLRLLHYPPVGRTGVMADQLGAGAHTDYGMLTLLLQDGVGGLQLRTADGAWFDVPPRRDAIVINSGDLLERWSNGRYRSTPHRVLPQTGSADRYSIALFVDPDSATRVAALASCVSDTNPPRYPPTSAGAHLQEKIEATHRG